MAAGMAVKVLKTVQLLSLPLSSEQTFVSNYFEMPDNVITLLKPSDGFPIKLEIKAK